MSSTAPPSSPHDTSAKVSVALAVITRRIQSWSFTPSCLRRADVLADVQDGSRLASRATPEGLVRVCLDDELIVEADGSDWTPYYEQGGQIGIATVRGSSVDPVLAFDDFGGGDARQPL